MRHAPLSLVFLLFACAAEAQPSATSPWTAAIDLLVDTAEDQPFGSGSIKDCTDGESDGDCSLREAIEVANGDVTLDRIGFAIAAGGGVATLRTTGLPELTDPGIEIDGYTQPGSSPSTTAPGRNAILAIELTAEGGVDAGLVLAADSQMVRGLTINRFGTQVRVRSSASHARIMGNYIGTAVSGYEIASPLVGLDLEGSDAVIGTDGDGVDDETEGNLIAGFEQCLLVSGVVENRSIIAGNVLGMVADGSDDIGSQRGLDLRNVVGVRVGTDGDGVSDAIERNVISGNSVYAVRIVGSLGGDSVLAGNIIGGTIEDPMDPTFRSPDPVFVSAPRTRIGTDGNGMGDAAERNWIVAGRRGFSGCGVGLTVQGEDAAGSVVAGNWIRSVFATAPLPCGSAIEVRDAPGVRIGTDGDGIVDAEEANVLEDNFRTGVFVRGDAARAAILGNRIRANGPTYPEGIGIDLAPAGVTLNDDGDLDGGPNGLQNFPEITEAVAGVGVSFVLRTTASIDFRVELFANAEPDESGYGQGERFLGSVLVSTDPSGVASGSLAIANLAEGEYVTATATPLDPTSPSGFGGTSEFSAALQVGPNSPGVSVVIDGPRGVRYLGTPAEGLTVDELAAQNLVRGVPGYYPDADPANLYTRYDPDKGAWLPSEGTGESLRLGYAFRWSFSDRASGNPDISVSRPLPFTLATDRPANTDAVTVDLNTTGSRWNYLANPFGLPVDLTDADTWPGYFGISSPAYVYDPVTRSWEDAPTVIEPWGAVRVRSKGPRIDGSGRTLRIPASAQIPPGDGPSLRASDVPALAFHLDGTDAAGLPLADAAMTLAFDAAATAGLEDERDVEKLQTPSRAYVSIGVRVGDALLGYDIRPFADARIPLALDLRGASPDLVVRWDASALPDGLPVVLVDLVTGAEADLRLESEYAFTAVSSPALSDEPTRDIADAEAATDRFVLRIGERLETAEPAGRSGALRLSAPRPNPSAGIARVGFETPETGMVRLSVIDARGREVAVLADGSHAAGRHDVALDSGSLAAGVYIVRLVADGGVRAERLVVVK